MKFGTGKSDLGKGYGIAPDQELAPEDRVLLERLIDKCLEEDRKALAECNKAAEEDFCG